MGIAMPNFLLIHGNTTKSLNCYKIPPFLPQNISKTYGGCIDKVWATTQTMRTTTAFTTRSRRRKGQIARAVPISLQQTMDGTPNGMLVPVRLYYLTGMGRGLL